MKALGWWLIVVGTLRLASVWFGFFDIWALRLAVFSKTTVTEVHGRTFGTWTLLTCTLCYICTFNLENKPLYLATMEISNLSTVGIICRNIDSMDVIAMEFAFQNPHEALLVCEKHS